MARSAVASRHGQNTSPNRPAYGTRPARANPISARYWRLYSPHPGPSVPFRRRTIRHHRHTMEAPPAARPTLPPAHHTQPLYARIARPYRGAIQSGALSAGAAMPSVRALTRLHQVSPSTALQACRSLEDEGLLEARPRSGYFVLTPRRARIAPLGEPDLKRGLDAAQYLGIHDRVSHYVAMSERHPARVDFAATYAAPEHYPGSDLKNAAVGALRRDPGLLVRPVAPKGEAPLRAAIARRALDAGMRLPPDDIVVTHGCHRGPERGLARRGPAGRHDRCRIAHVLRLVAGARMPGPARTRNPDQPEHGAGRRRAGVRVANAARHQGRGGGAQPAEPVELRDARCAEGAPRRAVRAAHGGANRGRHLQRAWRRRHAAEGTEALGRRRQRDSLRVVARDAGARHATGLDDRRALAGTHRDAEPRAEPRERSAVADRHGRVHGVERARPASGAAASAAEAPARANGRGHRHALSRKHAAERAGGQHAVVGGSCPSGARRKPCSMPHWRRAFASRRARCYRTRTASTTSFASAAARRSRARPTRP